MKITSQFKGHCKACKGTIAIGEEIEWMRDRTALQSNSFHLRCWVPPRVGPSLSDLECAEDFIKFALMSGAPLMRVRQEKIFTVIKGKKHNHCLHRAIDANEKVTFKCCTCIP